MIGELTDLHSTRFREGPEAPLALGNAARNKRLDAVRLQLVKLRASPRKGWVCPLDLYSAINGCTRHPVGLRAPAGYVSTFVASIGAVR
jgi:hypothetical protein